MSTNRTPWRFRLLVALLIPISGLLLSPLGATSSESLIESTTEVSVPVEIGTAIRIEVGDTAPRVIRGLEDNAPRSAPVPHFAQAPNDR